MEKKQPLFKTIYYSKIETCFRAQSKDLYPEISENYGSKLSRLTFNLMILTLPPPSTVTLVLTLLF